MTLDLDAVGRTAGPFAASWTSDDALVYALGVGAGQSDPYAELELTTENSEGHPQVVLPTFAIALALRDPRLRVDVGDIDRSRLVHAEQSLEMHRPLASSGTVLIRSQIAEIADKGSGALIVTECSAADAATGEPAFTSRLTAFLRGAGGFGGRTASNPRSLPERDPDIVIPAPTRPDQALLYRLSGDHNPLHVDPVFARRAGFDRPILHGLCTYGISARLLMQAIGKPTDALTYIDGRFTKPVYPGDTLEIHVWTDDTGEHLFRALDSSGAVVIDRGLVRV